MQCDHDERPFRELADVMKKNGMPLREILVSLQNKEYISKKWKIPGDGEVFNPYEIALDKTLLKGLFRASLEMGQEMFDHYPQFAMINGCMVGLRTVSKKFDSLEDAFTKYGKNIRWSQTRHNRIIELLDWANEHNIINYSMTSFIIDRRWEELEALKEGNAGINYDTVKLI